MVVTEIAMACVATLVVLMAGLVLVLSMSDRGHARARRAAGRHQTAPPPPGYGRPPGYGPPPLWGESRPYAMGGGGSSDGASRNGMTAAARSAEENMS
jgi:hypothetical protein